MTLTKFHRTCQKLDGGTDKELPSYITETKSITQLGDYGCQASLAVGLKGIGKSSSFRYLTEVNKAADVMIAINPDKFSLQLPNRDLSITTCRKQFEHDLIFEALGGVIRRSKEDSISRIDNALIRDAKKAVGYYVKLLKSVIKNLELGISFLGVGFTLKSGNTATVAGLTREGEIDFARSTLEKICGSGVRIRIVVDDPEEVFSINKALDIEMVGGFGLAALRLSEDIPNLKIISLFKSHVYDPVNKRVEDLSKYPDHFAPLAWNREKLTELITRRLRATGLQWHQLFPSSTEEEVMLVLARKIRNGPRDLLRWLDLALKDSQGAPLSLNNINNTYERMSQDAFEEFSRAYSASYDGFSQLVRIIFAKNTQTMFSPADFKEYLTRLGMRDKDFKAFRSRLWLEEIHIARLPRLLLNAGVISFKAKNKIVMPYEEAYTQPNLDGATQIFLTPCFVPALANSI